MIKKGFDFIVVRYNGIGIGVFFAWDKYECWINITLPFIHIQIDYCWKIY